MRSGRALFLVFATWGSASCSNPEGPSSVFGSYQLTAYTLGAGDLPLPSMQQASTPADIDKWVGARHSCPGVRVLRVPFLPTLSGSVVTMRRYET
jgi:hypothetical protein